HGIHGAGPGCLPEGAFGFFRGSGVVRLVSLGETNVLLLSITFYTAELPIIQKNLPSIQKFRSGHCTFFYFHWVVPVPVFHGAQGPSPGSAPHWRRRPDGLSVPA